MARPGAVRGTCVSPHVAVPDRHQPRARRATRERSSTGDADRDAPPRPDPVERPLWLEPYPDVLLDSIPDEAPEPRRGTRRGGDRARLHRRPAAPAAEPARGARAPRRARLPRGEAAELLDATETSVNGLLRRAERRSTRGSRPPGANSHRSRLRRRARARRGASPMRSRSATSRRRRAPHRGRLADDAAAPHGTRGRGDRRLPSWCADAAARQFGSWRRGPTRSRRSAATSRLPKPTRPRVRHVRADPRGRPDSEITSFAARCFRSSACRGFSARTTPS